MRTALSCTLGDRVGVTAREGGGGRRPHFVLPGYDGMPSSRQEWLCVGQGNARFVLMMGIRQAVGMPDSCRRWLCIRQGECPHCADDGYASGRGNARFVPTIAMRVTGGVVLYVSHTAMTLNLIVPHEWKMNFPLIIHSTRPACALPSHRKARSATEKTCGLDSFFTRATGREYFALPVPSLSSASYTQKNIQNTRTIHGT